ncbi:MAG: hypothetical protein Q4C09_04550 [Atopobiaceae bacterium]|nr:hypothetical protein [Atopobiaceae bacterium]
MASNDERRISAQEEEPWDPWHYGHPRMHMNERAKIFSPFDPLKGFREELRRREELVVQRQQHDPWLPEDDIASEPADTLG